MREAPFSVLVAITGAVIPTGLYVLIRISYSLFPDLMAEVSPYWVSVGLANLLIGAVCLVSQRDLRGVLGLRPWPRWD